MTNFSVTKNGIPLDPSLYDWNEKSKTFSSKEDGLVLDFAGIIGVTFKTGYSCTFLTASHCSFKTASSCTFKTGAYCSFKTGSHCTFNTGFKCAFEVGENCSLIRYDVKGVTEIPAYKKIKLNDRKISGYTVIEEKKEIPTFTDGKNLMHALLEFW
jgi:hypothetical protein